MTVRCSVKAVSPPFPGDISFQMSPVIWGCVLHQDQFRVWWWTDISSCLAPPGAAAVSPSLAVSHCHLGDGSPSPAQGEAIDCEGTCEVFHPGNSLFSRETVSLWQAVNTLTHCGRDTPSSGRPRSECGFSALPRTLPQTFTASSATDRYPLS